MKVEHSANWMTGPNIRSKPQRLKARDAVKVCMKVERWKIDIEPERSGFRR